MKKKDTEAAILQDAIDAFERTTNFKAYLADNLTNYTPLNLNDIKIRLTVNNEDIFLRGEVKNNINQANYFAAIHQPQLFWNENQLLITRYVTPTMADTLRDMNIQFIDTTGNVYLNDPPVYIFIKGNRLHAKYHPERLGRAFQPTGLRVLFALLCNPGLENAPMRKIAEKANVALGTVGLAIRNLKEMDYIIDMGKRGRRLVNKKKLLERWVVAYPEKLRPKLLKGHYRAQRFNWWEYVDIEDYNAFWGGETAAAKLTKYLKPQVATIYVGPNTGRLLLDNRIKKDPKGDIELRRIFWNFNIDWLYRNLVHPILIYADLLATGDPRNVETANVIYEQELLKFIGKN